MSRAGNGRSPDSRFEPRRLKDAYRVDWLLGDVPAEPVEYARHLASVWAGQRLPLYSVSVHASPAGHVRVAVEVTARDVTVAITDWARFVFDALRVQGLQPPGFVLAAAAGQEGP